MKRFLITAIAFSLVASPVLAQPVYVCEKPNEKVATVCDVLGQCWTECLVNGQSVGKKATSVNPNTNTPTDPTDPTDPTTKKGNPGNAKNVGNAGEKGKDNEPDRSGTRGSGNDPDRGNKGKNK